jgi:tripartite-type tricarboxylate transporter receptor subunit TctC
MQRFFHSTQCAASDIAVTKWQSRGIDMVPSQKFFKVSVLALAAVGATYASLQAQSFPSGTIHIVVAAATGTPPDIISRIVATDVAQENGWRIVVENKPGAMQTLAGAEVLRQPPDGFSLVSVSLPGMTAPALLPSVNYSIEKDFAAVAKLSTSYNVLVVNPSVPVHSVSELIDLLRAQPDKLTFSSGGFGTPAHLAGELFKLQTGVRATHVPYQQFPQAIGDLVSGINQFMFVTTLPVVDLIKVGKLRALAVTAPKRIAALPDVPTVIEAGFPQLVVQDWVGLLVRSETPNEIIVRLNEAINKSLAKPAVREAFEKLGAEPAQGSPSEFGQFIGSQIAYWGKVVKESGMKM